MAGEGSNSKVGLKTEVTPGTAVEPDTAIPFTNCGLVNPKAFLDSATIVSGTPAKSKGVPSLANPNGSIGMEVDCETIGQLIFYANGKNGKTTTSNYASTAKISSAPTGSAGGSGGTLGAGDYHYRVAAVYLQDLTGLLAIMPASSPTASAITVTSGQQVTLAFTDPTTLTPPTGFTYAGTVIYRTAAGGGNTTMTFLAYQSGTDDGFVDNGVDTNRDTTVTYVPATTLYKHVFKAAAASPGAARLDSFTTQVSKNVTNDEVFAGCMVSQMALEVGGADQIVTATFDILGLSCASATGEFSASAPTVRAPIPGYRTSAIINDTLSCEVQQMGFTLNNDLTPVPGLCNNDGYRKLSTNSTRTAGGSATLTYESQDLWNKAVNDETISFRIAMWGEPILASAGSLSAGTHGVKAVPFPRLLDIEMEKVTISDFSNPIEGPGQITASLNYQAFYDSGTTTEVTITLVNTTSAYA